jgi:secondary thiamine-phosphate synthase enzyme
VVFVAFGARFPFIDDSPQAVQKGLMKHAVTILTFDTPGRGLSDITREIAAWQRETGIAEGLLTLLCRHTSASLLIQENAAREVRSDLLDWLDRLAPESHSYAHDDEGPDDMPAHLKATLTGVNLSIPVIGGRLALGTWQGIYLAEHRRMAHRRQVALHLLGT